MKTVFCKRFAPDALDVSQDISSTLSTEVYAGSGRRVPGSGRRVGSAGQTLSTGSGTESELQSAGLSGGDDASSSVGSSAGDRTNTHMFMFESDAPVVSRTGAVTPSRGTIWGTIQSEDRSRRPTARGGGAFTTQSQ